MKNKFLEKIKAFFSPKKSLKSKEITFIDTPISTRTVLPENYNYTPDVWMNVKK